MTKILTVAEITSQFASEWVLVDSPQVDDLSQVKAGEVLFHSRDRDEVYRKAIELKPKHFAMLYTGKIPKDTAVVL